MVLNFKIVQLMLKQVVKQVVLHYHILMFRFYRFITNSTSDIKTKINTGFGSQNVIGFIRIIIKSNNATCIGRFTSNKVANNLWYLGGNSSSVSISTILANDGVGQVYGTLIDTGNYNVANGWGVECPTQSNFQNGSDIEIFIGLKNNVAL